MSTTEVEPPNGFDGSPHPCSSCSPLLLSIVPLPVLAQDSGTSVGPYIVTLQPGAKTEITV